MVCALKKMPVERPEFPEAALGQASRPRLLPGGKHCPGCRVGDGVCQPQPHQPVCP